MALVERRKKKQKKTRKANRAERLFPIGNGSQKKKSRRNKNKLGGYFDMGENIDQEKLVIHKDELKKSDLIKTFQKPTTKFDKFLGREHVLMKTNSQNENKRNREELEKLEDGDYVIEEGKFGNNTFKENIKTEDTGDQIIELEVEIEDPIGTNTKENEDFIKNTHNVI